MRWLSKILGLLLLLGLLAAMTFLASERSRLLLLMQEQAKEQGQEAKEKQGEKQGEEQSEEQQERIAELQQSVTRLQAELASEIGRREKTNALVDKVSEELREERLRHKKQVWEDKKYMPEGLRLALVSINECARADGYPGLRFIHARSLEEKKLLGAEVLDQDRRALTTDLYLAEEVTFHLDRAKAELTLRFVGGSLRTRSGREVFGEAGYALVLKPVDGCMWEQRLPYLVRAEGDYRVPEEKKKPIRMHPQEVAAWRARFEELLAAAKTPVRYRLQGFGRLENGQFKEAILLGYDQKRLLKLSAEAERLFVAVDEKLGTVQLCLHKGILRKAGGETPIPANGYQILLTGVEPIKAIDLMQGMVIRK